MLYQHMCRCQYYEHNPLLTNTLINITQDTQDLAKEKGIALIVHSRTQVTDVSRTNESQMRIIWTDLSGDTPVVADLVVDAALLCTGEQNSSAPVMLKITQHSTAHLAQPTS
jgi:hypothetical protein